MLLNKLLNLLRAGRPGVRMGVRMETHYRVECRDKDGRLKWVDDFDNLVTTVGKNDLLTNYFKGNSYTAAFYVGLTATAPTAAADTMSSHAGWTEVTAYSESTRVAPTLGTASAGSIDNSASKARFTVNATTTIGGAFLTTVSTKGGTTGTLYGIAAFSAGDKTLNSGDTLDVTLTLSA